MRPTGQTTGEAPEDTTNYETGYSVTVLDNYGNLQKTGHTFVGWKHPTRRERG